MELDDFTKAYIMAALWSSTDESDEPLDANYGVEDIAPSTLAKIIADCERFQTENAAQLVNENCLYDGCPMIEYAGHDFWLTRAGHGCGFWDGDCREDSNRYADVDDYAERNGVSVYDISVLSMSERVTADGGNNA